MKNIVLIGLPGSGKTTLGSRLAQATGRPFVDLDEAVERRAGSSISELFATHGEEGFRELESRAVEAQRGKRGIVLATGGGTLLRKANLQALRENGILVFLDRPVQAICADIQVAHRPLLQQGPKALEALARQRRPLYLSAAHLTLDGGRDIEAVLEQLVLVHTALAAKGYAVIGRPIAHSLSPTLHRLIFAAQGMDAPYTAIRVSESGLAAFVAAARHGALRGFNVTLPHKQAILPLLDEVEEQATLCGAVNTVVCHNNRLHGYNTDMQGLHLSLRQAGSGFAGRRITVLGAGGAAVAAAVKAGLEGAAAVHIAARNTHKAGALAARVAGLASGAATHGSWGPGELEEACRHSDLLINATPLGMAGFGEDFESLDFLRALPPESQVCDLVYTPPETALLKRARALGHRAQNGLGMLIFQALLAQERFLGKPLDKPRLYPAIHNDLVREMEMAVL